MVAALLVTACASGAPQTATTQASGPGIQLRVRMPGDWASLDPWTLFAGAGAIAGATYDRLVSQDNGKIIPYVATSWTQTPTSITFKLRNDVVCADGEKMTPTVILNHFKRMFDPAKLSQVANRQFGPGPFTLAADDANLTFTFTMGAPFSDALLGFSLPSAGSIVCSAGTKNPAMLVDGTNGSGPYVIDSAVHGDFAKLKLRPEWNWGPNGVTAKTPGLPREILLKAVSNETTAANLLLTGALDISTIQGPDIVRLLGDKTVTGLTAKPLSVHQMLFQHGSGSLTEDESIREALSYAVDAKAWNQAATDGKGVTSTSFVTPDGDCYEPETAKLYPAYNMDKAKSILTSRGYTYDSSGKLLKDGKPVPLKILGNPEQVDGPEYLFGQFTKLGFAVTLDKPDGTSYSPKYRSGDWNVVVHTTTSTTNPYSSAALFSGPLPPSGTNFGRIVDPELNALVTTGQSTVGDTRCNAWKAVQRRVLEKHHFLPMASSVSYTFIRQGYEAPAGAPTPQSYRSPTS